MSIPFFNFLFLLVFMTESKLTRVFFVVEIRLGAVLYLPLRIDFKPSNITYERSESLYPCRLKKILKDKA